MRPLELNYRSTPQILAVGKALLEGSDTMEKQLIPTISGEGRPPVRMLVVDTEEDEGAIIAKVGDCMCCKNHLLNCVRVSGMEAAGTHD